jgi:hypothetical protein
MLPTTSYHITKQQQKEHLSVPGGSEREFLKKGRSPSSARIDFPRISVALAGLVLAGISIACLFGPSLSTQLDSIYPIELETQEVIAEGRAFASHR